MLAAAGTLAIALMFQTMAGAREPDSPCNEKCLADYEAEAAKCGKIEAEDARTTCQNGAYARYKSCRDGCSKKNNGCLEHCYDKCYEVMDKCKGDCKDDPSPRTCRERCSNEYAACLKECDDKCKGK